MRDVLRGAIVLLTLSCCVSLQPKRKPRQPFISLRQPQSRPPLSAPHPDRWPSLKPTAPHPDHWSSLKPTTPHPDHWSSLKPTTPHPDRWPSLKPTAPHPDRWPSLKPTTPHPDRWPSLKPTAPHPDRWPSLKPTAPHPDHWSKPTAAVAIGIQFSEEPSSVVLGERSIFGSWHDGPPKKALRLVQTRKSNSISLTAESDVRPSTQYDGWGDIRPHDSSFNETKRDAGTKHTRRKRRQSEIDHPGGSATPLSNDPEDEVTSDGLEDDLTTYSVNSSQLCRSWQVLLPRDLYLLDTCAWCYLDIRLGVDGFSNHWRSHPSVYPGNDHTIVRLQNPANSSEMEWAQIESPRLRSSLEHPRDLQRWEECTRAAAACCDRMLAAGPASDVSCPRTWDRMQCWEDTDPGTLAEARCPHFMTRDTPCADSSARARKLCQLDGSWFRHNRSNNEWTDFRECAVTSKVAENILYRMRWHIAVCSVSVIALLPALIIFCSYRQLQVRRITLHKHLFLSLVLEAGCNICLRSMQISSPVLIKQSPWWCVTLNVALKYLRQSNYMWFFNEGFYLHRLLASAFAEQRNFFLFYFLGWVVPVLPVTVYMVVRVVHFKSTSDCFILPQNGIEWILMILPFAAILTNVVFLINIIRILVIKLQATSQSRNDISQYRKMVRATLMVVPLFGLQFLFTIYRPAASACQWVNVYNILNHIIEGSTGTIVAVIFCYMNSEVKALLAKTFRCFTDEWESRGLPRIRDSVNQRSGYSMSTVHTTVADAGPDTVSCGGYKTTGLLDIGSSGGGDGATTVERDGESSEGAGLRVAEEQPCLKD